MSALDDLGWAGMAPAGWAACCTRTATADGCDGAGMRWPKGEVDVAEGPKGVRRGWGCCGGGGWWLVGRGLIQEEVKGGLSGHVL
jgi:hypothetical protein